MNVTTKSWSLALARRWSLRSKDANTDFRLSVPKRLVDGSTARVVDALAFGDCVVKWVNHFDQ